MSASHEVAVCVASGYEAFVSSGRQETFFDGGGFQTDLHDGCVPGVCVATSVVHSLSVRDICCADQI